MPEASNGILLDYAISCNMEETTDITFNFSSSDLSTVLDGLTPFTNYTCEVRASTGAGEGPPSNEDTARTDESGNYVRSVI